MLLDRVPYSLLACSFCGYEYGALSNASRHRYSYVRKFGIWHFYLPTMILYFDRKIKPDALRLSNEHHYDENLIPDAGIYFSLTQTYV